MVNLDYICIKYGQELKADKSTITNSLGVLQEDGVYAMFLWLETKDKNIRSKLISLLNRRGIREHLMKNSDNFSEDNFKKFCEKLQYVAEDIDNLLFMKKILERTLTYALYHAKINEGVKNVE